MSKHESTGTVLVNYDDIKPLLHAVVASEHKGDDLMLELGSLAIEKGWEMFVQWRDSPRVVARVQRRRTLRARFGLRWRRESRKLGIYDLQRWLDSGIEP